MINAIVCPLRNLSHLTRRAHATFSRQDCDPAPEILYIDNASTDNTPRLLAGWDCHYIRNSTPKCVAASWNQGLEWWWKQGAEHALVVNNDVELLSFTYKLLLRDGGGFVTGVGNEYPGCITGGYIEEECLLNKRPHPDFSCFLIRKETWDRVGRFDEGYKGAFCEDWDYHVRLHKAGVYAHCINLPFYHAGSATINAMSEREQKALQQMAANNRSYFARKWGVEGASPAYYALFEASPAGA